MSAIEAAPGPQIGRPVLRLEDRPLLTGAGAYIDDLSEPGQLFARIVRSPVAHGRIRSVTTGAAASLPGVVSVITAQDIPAITIPVRMMASEEARPVTQPPLARDLVRYVGEPLAVVVATDPYLAEDAASLVAVEIDPLPAVLDGPSAAHADSIALHETALSGNVINRLHARHGEDVEALMRSAAVVISDRLTVSANRRRRSRRAGCWHPSTAIRIA